MHFVNNIFTALSHYVNDNHNDRKLSVHLERSKHFKGLIAKALVYGFSIQFYFTFLHMHQRYACTRNNTQTLTHIDSTQCFLK